MIVLRHGDLQVDLLDPASREEQARQGIRYCWGGYIWQVTDVHAGPLCAGPEWPHPHPSPWNGQGLPESFRHREWGTALPLTVEDGRGFVLGAGEVTSAADGSLQIARPCRWLVTPTSSACEFATEQVGFGWRIHLRRRVELRGRELVSHTQVRNRGSRPFPLHWFAHPFFALTAGRIEATLPPGWSMEPNPGFILDPGNRLTQRRTFAGREDGCFQLLRVSAGAPLRTKLTHPALTEVQFATDFGPTWCPIWGNGNTWSIEPYRVAVLAPGMELAWALRYEFGPPH